MRSGARPSANSNSGPPQFTNALFDQLAVVLGTHFCTNSFARVVDASLREKPTQRFTRDFVGCFHFALGLLFQLFDFALSRSSETLSLGLGFLHSLFADRANVGIESAQQGVGFGNLRFRAGLLFLCLDQLLFDRLAARAESFADRPAQNVNPQRHKDGEIEKFPEFETRVIKPVLPVEKRECNHSYNLTL